MASTQNNCNTETESAGLVVKTRTTKVRLHRLEKYALGVPFPNKVESTWEEGDGWERSESEVADHDSPST